MRFLHFLLFILQTQQSKHFNLWRQLYFQLTIFISDTFVSVMESYKFVQIKPTNQLCYVF